MKWRLNIMKKFIVMILALVMVLGMLAGCGKADSMTLEEGKLIMSTNAAFPPY